MVRRDQVKPETWAIVAGRPAGQVDDLNGAVVKAASEVGLKAPLNARLHDLVHAIERGEEKIAPDQLERLQRAVSGGGTHVVSGKTGAVE